MQRDDERREKRNKTIIGVFIAGIMVLSTFGFVLNYAMDNGRVEKVNGIKFQQSGQQVLATINGKMMGFNYFPSQVQQLPMDEKARSLLTSTPAFYFTSDPSDPFAKEIDNVAFSFSTVLPEMKDVYPVLGFTNTTGFDRPGIDCTNATSSMPVVYMHYGKSTGINVTGDCVDVSAQSSYDVYRLHDKMMFVFLGVDNEQVD